MLAFSITLLAFDAAKRRDRQQHRHNPKIDAGQFAEITVRRGPSALHFRRCIVSAISLDSTRSSMASGLAHGPDTFSVLLEERVRRRR